MRTTIEGLDIQPVKQSQDDTTDGNPEEFHTSVKFSQMLVEALVENWEAEDCVSLRVFTQRRNIRVTGAVRSQRLYDRIHEVASRINQEKAGTVDTSAMRIDPDLVHRFY